MYITYAFSISGNGIFNVEVFFLVYTDRKETSCNKLSCNKLAKFGMVAVKMLKMAMPAVCPKDFDGNHLKLE
jgi:hypothetical protein